MMQRKIMTALLLIAVSVLSACGQVKSTINVVDEQGQPIQGAEVFFSYVNFKNEENLTVATNEKGVAENTGSAELRINLRVSKEGYYDTRYHKSEGTSLSKDENHDLTVILREVKNPIAMFAKKVEIEMPVLGKKIGFDLKACDFVKPHGRGVTSDFALFAEKRFVNSKNYSTRLNVHFEGKYEGMYLDQEAQRGGVHFDSDFKTARLGKLDDYKQEASFVASKSEGNGYKGSTNEAIYLIRSRANVNEDGELISCHYSKIRDGINISRGAGLEQSMPILRFTYYFNPTPNDRNLEFDPERNLFKKLPHNEQVRKP